MRDSDEEHTHGIVEVCNWRAGRISEEGPRWKEGGVECLPHVSTMQITCLALPVIPSAHRCFRELESQANMVSLLVRSSSYPLFEFDVVLKGWLRRFSLGSCSAFLLAISSALISRRLTVDQAKHSRLLPFSPCLHLSEDTDILILLILLVTRRHILAVNALLTPVKTLRKPAAASYRLVSDESGKLSFM